MAWCFWNISFATCIGSAEAQNKFDRRNRLFHARKSSREANLTDIVHYHLEASDPLVVSHMRFPKQRKTPPTPEMAALLKVGEVDEPEAEEDVEEDEEEEINSEDESDSEDEY